MKLPPVKMFDVEKVLLGISPTTAAGEADDTTVFVWTSSAPDQVALEEVPGTNGRQYWALTPLESGSANITIEGKGYEMDQILIEYSPFVPGKINLSVGNPVPDTDE